MGILEKESPYSTTEVSPEKGLQFMGHLKVA